MENDKRVKLESWERQQLQRLLALLCGSPTLQSGFNRNPHDLTEITNLKVTICIGGSINLCKLLISNDTALQIHETIFCILQEMKIHLLRCLHTFSILEQN